MREAEETRAVKAAASKRMVNSTNKRTTGNWKKNTEREKRRSGARDGYIEEQGDSPGGLFHASSPIGSSPCEVPATFRSLSIYTLYLSP